MVDSDADALWVLLGNGDGTFGTPTFYPVGDRPWRAASMDLDGDGAQDLAVAGRNSRDVSLLFGNGNGTFQPAVSHDLSLFGGDAWDVVAADLNQDELPDLVVAAGATVVLLNEGKRSFAAPFSVAELSTDVALANFNHDQDPDLLVRGNSVSAYLGGAGGTFQLGTRCPELSDDPAGMAGMAAAALNGDGMTDIAASEGEPNVLSVVLARRSTSAVTVKVSKTQEKVKVNGLVSPAHPNIGSVSLTLFKRKANKWDKVAQKQTDLGSESRYSSSFVRPDADRCKITARFLGDSHHKASQASKVFNC